MISESADVLINLINQLLDFSSIDTGENDLKPSHFNLPVFFRQIAFSPFGITIIPLIHFLHILSIVCRRISSDEQTSSINMGTI